jgi:prevent-host-death family protein
MDINDLTGHLELTIIVTMTQVGIAQLKAKLSSYLDQVKAGHEVVVTDRGRPVARLVPYDEGGKRTPDMERLARAGLIRLGRGEFPKELLTPSPVKDPEGKVLKALLEEREEGP